MNLSYTDLADSNTTSVIAKVGSGVKSLVCGAYHNYKDWYHQNIDIGSAGGDLLENFWNNVCPQEPPPMPQPPPFTGGQCVCTLYKVNCDWRIIGYENTPQGTYFNGFGPIGGIRILEDTPQGDTIQVFARRSLNGTCQPDSIWHDVYATGAGTGAKLSQAKIVEITTLSGAADTCGNPPSPPGPIPTAPPDVINDNVTIVNNDGVSITVPVSINPKIFMPDFNINASASVFNNDLSFNPQFNVNPPPNSNNNNFNPAPNLNFNFGPGGVGVSFGPGGSASNDFNNAVNFNNIIDIKDNLSDINIDIKKVADSLGCDPCEKLKEIKDILTYKPTYTSASIANFQSVTRDNLFNLGYLEIELSKLPHSTKIIFGGDSPNAMYTGWLFWRHNQFNFEKIIIHSAKSVYHAPKWANGFAICCSHGARANVFYYTEVKQ